MTTIEEIALLQRAIWKLEEARGYINEACEGVDPNASAIAKIINRVQSDIDALQAE